MEELRTRGQQRRVHPRVKLRTGKRNPESIEVVQIPKDMEEIELMVRQAFRDSNTPADAGARVMKLLKKQLNHRLNSIITNTCGNHHLLRERIVEFKKQLCQ